MTYEGQLRGSAGEFEATISMSETSLALWSIFTTTMGIVSFFSQGIFTGRIREG